MEKKYSVSNFLCLVGLTVFLGFGLVSCSGTKQLTYFRNLPDSTYMPQIVKEDRVIQPGDVLEITFSGADEAAAAFFNKKSSSLPATSGNTGATTGTAATPASTGATYTVDPDGYVLLPMLGQVPTNNGSRMNFSGYTAKQFAEKLESLVKNALVKPIVEVKFTTFRITVLGEVRSPGSFSLPLGRTTLFEALAAAGDLPHTARRYNIKVFRDYNGQRTVATIDLRDKNVLYNPDIFQIRPNDVFYVQPRPGSIFREDFGIFTSIITLVVSMVTLGLTIKNK